MSENWFREILIIKIKYLLIYSKVDTIERYIKTIKDSITKIKNTKNIINNNTLVIGAYINIPIIYPSYSYSVDIPTYIVDIHFTLIQYQL